MIVVARVSKMLDRESLGTLGYQVGGYLGEPFDSSNIRLRPESVNKEAVLNLTTGQIIGWISVRRNAEEENAPFQCESFNVTGY